ncbi:MAG: EAL domain-containing protein [Bryobacterales bacterium]|nr:EAL domain-containing protein [Bryobacterales bacterium]
MPTPWSDLLLAVGPDGKVEILSGCARPLPPRLFRQLVAKAGTVLASGRQSRFRYSDGRGSRSRLLEVTMMPVQAPPVPALIRDISGERRADAEAARIRRSLSRLSHALTLASHRLVAHDDFDQALREICHSAAEALQVRQAGVWLLAGDWESLHCRQQYNRETRQYTQGARIEAGDLPAYFEALRQDRPIAAHNALTDPRTAGLGNGYLLPLGLSSVLDTPLRRSGRVCGVMSFEHGGPPRRWTAEEEVFASSISEMAAVVLDDEERLAVVRRLEREANEDSLTGLANRAALLRHMEECEGGRGGGLRGGGDGGCGLAALMIVEMDRLEAVNQALGHAAGDQLLAGCARTLRAAVRDEDMVARIGGNQFALFLESASSREAVLALAHRTLDLLRHPLEVNGRTIQAGASAGIAYSSAEAPVSPEDLLRRASLATSRARKRAGSRVEVFRPFMHDTALHRLNLEDEIRQGLHRGEFEPFLQPIVSLADAAVVSFEALLRWRHPSGQLLTPRAFLASAEETGQVIPMGWSSLRQLCAWIGRVHAATGKPARVSYNLSQKQFQAPDLLDRIASIVHSAHIDPSWIQIEITESVVSTYNDTAARLASLKAHGFVLAVDDFGTGYSSLSLLHSFPLDVLKIDRSFIARLDSGGEEIVRAIVALARALDMRVVAEGIETLEQARKVAGLGCEYGQGYWLGRPMDTHAAASLLMHRGAQNLPHAQRLELIEEALPEAAPVN